MYEAYWGLKERPFKSTPDPKYVYLSRQHKEALARLLYVVEERNGAALLTGEYGSGKTLLSRVLWHRLQLKNIYQCAFVLNPRLSDLELLREILYQFTGIEASHDKIDLLHALHKRINLEMAMGLSFETMPPCWSCWVLLACFFTKFTPSTRALPRLGIISSTFPVFPLSLPPSTFTISFFFILAISISIFTA